MQPRELLPHGCCEEPTFTSVLPWGCSVSLSYLTSPGGCQVRAGAEGRSCRFILLTQLAGTYLQPCSGTGSRHRCQLCWFILASHITRASRVWGHSALLPWGALVPSSSMAATKALCAIKDRPTPLPFSFLRSISLACHGGDRTEVLHRQNGLCWSRDRSKGWVMWKEQQSRAESQREHLDSQAWEIGGEWGPPPLQYCLWCPSSFSSSGQCACSWLCHTQHSWETLSGFQEMPSSSSLR